MTLSAQVGGSGTIQGTVQDPSGAALPGANVTATNLATAVTTARQTTAAGFYVLSPLQPGDYSVKVEASGFQTITQSRISVAALQTVGWDPKMAIGTSTQSITVEDAPPSLHTEDATLGASMGNELYSALPLARITIHNAVTAPMQNGSSRMATIILAHLGTEPEFRIPDAESRKKHRRVLRGDVFLLRVWSPAFTRSRPPESGTPDEPGRCHATKT
jgi:hypothetical protein